MQGWALIVEAVRQVRGECGARQVADAALRAYMTAAPVITSLIYGTGPAVSDYAKPLPPDDPANRPFWEALRRGEVQRAALPRLRHASLPGGALLRALPLRRSEWVATRGARQSSRRGACSTAPYFRRFATRCLTRSSRCGSTVACASSPIWSA